MSSIEPAGASKSANSAWLVFGVAACLVCLIIGGAAIYLIMQSSSGTPKKNLAAVSAPQASADTNEAVAVSREPGAPVVAEKPMTGPNAAVLGPMMKPVDLGRRAQLKGDGEPIADIAFSADGRKLAVISRRGAVSLFDLMTRQRLLLKESLPYRHNRGELRLLAFTQDSKSLISGNHYQVEVWNTTTGAKERHLGKLPDEIFDNIKLGGMTISNNASNVVLRETSVDGKTRYVVWEIATGREKCAFPWTGYGYPSMTFSPDGKLLAAIEHGGEKTMLIDVEAGATLSPLNFGYDSVVLLNRPDRLLGWKEREFVEWEIKPDRKYQIKGKGKLPKDVEPPFGRLIPTADGSLVVFSDGRVWDVAKGSVKTRFLQGALAPIVVAPDERSLVALKQENQMLRRLDVLEADLMTGEVRTEHQFTLQGDPQQSYPDAQLYPEPIDVSLDGRLLAVGANTGDVLLQPLVGTKAPALTQIADMSLAAMESDAVSISSGNSIRLQFALGGRYLFLTSRDWTSLLDVNARTFRFNLSIRPVLLHPDFFGGSVFKLAAGSGNFRPVGGPTSAVILENSPSVWATAQGGWIPPIRPWVPLTDHPSSVGELPAFRRFEFPLDGDPARSLRPDPNFKNSIVIKYTRTAGIPLGTIDTGLMRITPVTDPFEAKYLAVAPDGKTLIGVVRTIQYKAVEGGNPPIDISTTPPLHLALLDPRNLKEKGVLIEEYDGPLGVFSPNSQLLAQPHGRAIRIWNLETGKEVPNVMEPGEGLTFLHDNQTLMVTSRKGTGVLYDLESGQVLREIDLARGHSGGLGRSACSPTQALCATVGYEGNLILRDIESGDVVARRAAHQQVCEDVSFSPDGTMLATVSVREKSIKLWKVPENAEPSVEEDSNPQIVEFTTKVATEALAGSIETATASELATARKQPSSTTKMNADPSSQSDVPRRDASTVDDAISIETNSIGMHLATIPAGEFQMGALADDSHADPNERPRHQVRITRSFAIGIHEVTIGQFRQFTTATGYRTDAERDGRGGPGYDPGTQRFIDEWRPEFDWKNVGFLQSSDHPVTNVSWSDAKAFCDWLSDKERRTYRLPTEAEWEYACRAGTDTTYWTGNDPASLQGAENIADQSLGRSMPGLDWLMPWDDGFAFTANVGSFRPNPWGLYDMLGNVGEWTEDRYGSNYYSIAPNQDPTGPATGDYRVWRAGCWINAPEHVRCSLRFGGSVLSDRSAFAGFRVVRVIPP